jgi:hypothetical protein
LGELLVHRVGTELGAAIMIVSATQTVTDVTTIVVTALDGWYRAGAPTEEGGAPAPVPG